jgi:hypothetical protein
MACPSIIVVQRTASCWERYAASWFARGERARICLAKLAGVAILGLRALVRLLAARCVRAPFHPCGRACLPKNDGVEGAPAGQGEIKSGGARRYREIERAPTLLPVHGHINISPSVFLLLSCQVETRLGSCCKATGHGISLSSTADRRSSQ